MLKLNCGKITVLVMSQSSLPIENACISVINTENGIKTSAKASKDGFASFYIDNSPVHADIFVNSKGYKPLCEEKIPIYPNVTTVILFTLDRIDSQSRSKNAN